VRTISELSDPRLVAIYDTVNPIAEYETFYLDLAAKRSASSIIDIGCGTGLLTRHVHRAVAWFFGGSNIRYLYPYPPGAQPVTLQ
jgi:2-polyprenyl-3-methyl-5-hydroxy-6-metoxy-1,4-benzoquinol methylase